MQHAPQMVEYPQLNDCKLKFKDYNKEHPLKFYLVCDYESFLTPLDPDSQTKTEDARI